MLDICFINPLTTNPNNVEIFYPLTLVTLGAMAKRYGYSVEVVDFDLLLRAIPDEEFISAAYRHLGAINARVFGVTTVCSNYPSALLLVKLIKQIHPTAIVIVGGPQASMVPLETLEAFPEVDLIVCGEGENALIELLQSDFREENIKNIAGLAIRLDGKPILTNKRKLVTDLDSFPLPDFGLAPLDKYFACQEKRFGDARPTMALINTGVGCPHACAFCSTSVMWSHKCRMKSPARILSEMNVLNEQHGLTVFNLSQDNFTNNSKYLSEFVEYFQRHNPGFQWSASSRTDCINYEQLSMMKKAGCICIGFGLETASQRLQKVIGKNLNVEEVFPLIEKCTDLGITPLVSFMLGFPDETIEELESTIATAAKCRQMGMGGLALYKVNVYAGTRLYREQLPNLKKLKLKNEMDMRVPKIKEIWELIERYPHLFPNFYLIPNPYFSDTTLDRIIQLFQNSIGFYKDAMHFLIHQLGYRPWSIWEEWCSWCNNKGYHMEMSRAETIRRIPDFVEHLSSKVEITESPFLSSVDIFTGSNEI